MVCMTIKDMYRMITHTTHEIAEFLLSIKRGNISLILLMSFLIDFQLL